jgi:hypothetical protein
MHNRREGMLRPEFQDWYPSLTAGRWYPADELTGLVMDHLQHGSPQWRPQGRVPSDHHFVFRGGESRSSASGRSRASDRSPRRSGESQHPPHLDS